MPLLQSIVEEFDRELTRLQALRSIVAGLSRTPEVIACLISSPASLEEETVQGVATASPADEQSRPPRNPRADKGKPRVRQADKSRTIEQARAFAATIPSGPVVINPTRLAEERIQRKQSRKAEATVEPVQAAEDLDALSRSLAARWNTGMVQ